MFCNVGPTNALGPTGNQEHAHDAIGCFCAVEFTEDSCRSVSITAQWCSVHSFGTASLIRSSTFPLRHSKYIGMGKGRQTCIQVCVSSHCTHGELTGLAPAPAPSAPLCSQNLHVIGIACFLLSYLADATSVCAARIPKDCNGAWRRERQGDNMP